MNELWAQALIARGARIEAGAVADFGQPQAERAALARETTLHPIADGLLLASGRDARSFLNSQLTSDVQNLGPARAQYAAYCTPKGRVLATLLVIDTPDGFLLQLARELTESIATRLRKYVLRAAVQLADVSERFALIGIGGPDAPHLLAEAVGPLPGGPLGSNVGAQQTTIALEQGCYQLVAAPAQAGRIWDLLSRARACGDPGWRWRRIQAGVPWVGAATQELFVPQMANLDLLGGISFSKGCYPGQEIVARAHYRGEVKRRLFRGHTPGTAHAGDALFLAGSPAQSVGHVANAAPAPDGSVALLAVVLSEAAESGGLRLGRADGPEVVLEFRDASQAV